MKKLLLTLGAVAASLLVAGCDVQQDQSAQTRQTHDTAAAANAADRETGYPRMVNYAQRKLLKNAYEDMDQTTLAYVYTQGLDGKMICLGQSLGYGVPYGTQFTAPYYNKYGGNGNYYQVPQPEPNQLYMPDTGEATIVDLINPENGEAHTAMVEPRIITVPFELPPSVVTTPCPKDVDPTTVKDVKERSVATQLGAK